MKTLKLNQIIGFITTIIWCFQGVDLNAQTGVGVNTTTPKSSLEVNGSLSKKVTTITTSATLNATDNTVLCNNAATPITVTLPTAVGILGRLYNIKKGTSTSDITIDGNASETIDGGTTVVLSDQMDAITLFSDGANWRTTTYKVAPYPMGEIQYFSTTGTRINILFQSTTGSDNLVVCAPATTFAGVGEFDNGGANTGRLRYTGKNTKTFHIACTISGTLNSNTSSTLVFGIAKNGTVVDASKVLNRFANTSDIQSTSLHLMITMNTNDFLEIYVGNISNSTDFKFNTLNLFALGM